MSLQHQSDLTASLSLIATSSGSVWCVVSHQNEVLLSPAQMKAEAAAQAVQQGVPVLATFEALSPNYNYQAYCYIENEAGIGMSEGVNATRVLFTTPDYPVLTLSIPASATNPGYGSVVLTVLLSTPSVLYCRAREYAANQLPPTEAWIAECVSLNETHAALANYLTVPSLAPATLYRVYCTAQSWSGLLPLQSLAERTLNVTTAQGECLLVF